MSSCYLGEWAKDGVIGQVRGDATLRADHALTSPDECEEVEI